MGHLNTVSTVVFLIVAGRAFRSRGPATYKAISPCQIAADCGQEVSRFW